MYCLVFLLPVYIMYDTGPNWIRGLFTNEVVLAEYKILLMQSRKYKYTKINMQCVFCKI